MNAPSAPELPHIGRREFMKLAAASIALGGMGGCSPPPEKIVPYAHSPEGLVPGKPVFYATAMALDGFAKGVLVESNMGCPTKVEGNTLHPASLGATDVFAQASVLGLWDPDRSHSVMRDGEVSAWPDFLATIGPEVERLRRMKGAGLHLLTGTVTSPTLAAQLHSLLEAYPQTRWHLHQAVGRENAAAAAQSAFGTSVDSQYHLEQADVIVSLDADLLGAGPDCLHNARRFAGRRNATQAMTRLYVVESTVSITGAAADHRLAVRPTDVEAFARLVAARLGLRVSAPSGMDQRSATLAHAVATDLAGHSARSLVVAGERQPPAVHVLAHAINARLGASGVTVSHTDSVAVRPPADRGGTLADLTDALGQGEVHTLVIAGINPVATAPADLGFAALLAKAPLTIHIGLYRDETGIRANWHLPETHYMEAWSDVRAFDGTATIVQPLIAPLYEGVSVHALVAALAGDSGRSAHALVRDHWQGARSDNDFEAFWQQALHDGVIPDTAFAHKAPAFQTAALENLASPPERAPGDALEIVFAPDPCVWDGQFANNAWLQELPKPVTTLTWDNAALLGPTTARRLGFEDGDLVELHHGKLSVIAPVRVVPGHAEGTVTAPLGYGRTHAGSVGNGRGFDAYSVRTSSALWIGKQVELARTGRRATLAATQNHHRMHGREPVRSATVDAFRANPGFARTAPHASLYPRYPRGEYAWAMSIDLGACIGCNACTIACQAENNIPVVGKEQVELGREMHWIRVDTYFSGSPEAPTTFFQPVPCMHCEDAPCELVCPVGATMHDSGGLNVQVYNRCVGTRFCSNNCPYKVRRFNFLQFADTTSETLRAQRNPEVTVRRRGVMEKCTYCLQRITTARIAADARGDRIRDGEVVTACQAVCPTQAIVFGNLADPASRVAQVKESPLDYTLLDEENTRPRTTYLAKLTNPNPDLGRDGA
jgi:Fe-S-cluster-containing dehydrogenase component/anaerobic selenocysteine-containing dehydrogenase